MALRCLLVDDSAHFLQGARVLLEREGLVVDVASTGAEALRRAEEFRPDVVLVDISLGGESGFELVRRFGDEGDTTTSPACELRIILLSTHQQEDFEELIEESPALGFLAKSSLSARAVYELLHSKGGRPPGGWA
jgi:CheY-like chemotaxis protein